MIGECCRVGRRSAVNGETSVKGCSTHPSPTILLLLLAIAGCTPTPIETAPQPSPIVRKFPKKQYRTVNRCLDKNNNWIPGACPLPIAPPLAP